MSGKGSVPRPFSVSDDIYSANWGLVFGVKPSGNSNSLESDNEPGEPDQEGQGQAERLA